MIDQFYTVADAYGPWALFSWCRAADVNAATPFGVSSATLARALPTEEAEEENGQWCEK